MVFIGMYLGDGILFGWKLDKLITKHNFIGVKAKTEPSRITYGS